MSGFMEQMLAIAGVLVSNPRVWLMDEPSQVGEFHDTRANELPIKCGMPLAQQIVFRSGQEFDLDDKPGPHPMDAADKKREAANQRGIAALAFGPPLRAHL